MPSMSRWVEALRPSVFATLAEKMKALSQPPICLHIGDTYALPEASACWQGMDLSSATLYRYSHPHGLPGLLQAICHKLRDHNRLSEVEEDWLQITCGATQALHCGVQALLEPGQAVLVLGPYWPLFGGMCRLLGVEVRELNCTPRLERGEPLRSLLQEVDPSGLQAIYFANPNNPDGYLYSQAELMEITRFAQDHDLWIFSDECYEHYCYDGARHVSIASLPQASSRCLSVFSFSKSYAMAGHRLGYAVGHPGLMRGLRRVANHTVYNVSATVQQAGLAMVRADSAAHYTQTWLPRYQEARDQMVEALGCPAPVAGAYCFPHFESQEQAWDFLERALEQGVVLAPGAAFGEAYGHCLRICFTCVPPEQLAEACRILASLSNR